MRHYIALILLLAAILSPRWAGAIIAASEPVVMSPSTVMTVDTSLPQQVADRYAAAYIVWNVTAISGGSTDAQLLIEFWDPVSQGYRTLVALAPITATGTYIYAFANATVSSTSFTSVSAVILPKKWRVTINLVSATSITSSIALIPLQR